MQISSDNVQLVNQLIAIGIPITLVAIIGNCLLFGFCLKSIIGKTSSRYHRIIRGVFDRLSSTTLGLQRAASRALTMVV
jgi:hypothetical protein